MIRYRASIEEILQDKEDFYTQGGGKEQAPPEVDLHKIGQMWSIFNEIQNGENFDDYVMADRHKVEFYIERWCPPPAKLAILGTGTGREVQAAKLLGYDVVGTTFGKENPSFAKWKFGLDIDYVDNNTLPYPSESFDVVAAFQVLEHCWAPHFFFIECNRILKKNGLLILEWPSLFGAHRSSATGKVTENHDNMEIDNEENLHHMCCWSPAQAYTIARKCNFKKVDLFTLLVELNKDGSQILEPIEKCSDTFFSNRSLGNNIVLTARRSLGSDLPEYMQKAFSIETNKYRRKQT